jgi:hypothetical protein
VKESKQTMIKIALTLYLLAILLTTAFAQPANNAAQFEKQYKERIQKEYLDDVYIPKDLTDAFIQLNRLIDNASKEKFKHAPEEVVARRLHFSLGRWIIHNWSFYEGSRLTIFINGLGLSHPDDMARFIIIAYHRSINRNPLEVKALVTDLQEKRKAIDQERLLKGQVIHQEVIKKEDKN